MLDRYSLNINRRGTRNYLHSSSVFDALCKLAPEVCGPGAWVKHLGFRSFLRTACAFVLEQPAGGAPGRAVLVAADGSETRGWLVETAGSAADPEPYDEDRLVAKAVLDIAQRSIAMPGLPGYTPVEHAVALTKKLHYGFAAEVPGKWIFAQIDLLRPMPEPLNDMKIQVTHFIDNRFSVSRVLANGADIGSIRFIVGVP